MKSVLYTLLICFVFISCNRQTLRFFFDGVDIPEENNGVTSEISTAEPENKPATALTDTARTLPYRSIHPTYKKKLCFECHNTDYSNRLQQKQPDLCYRCHKPFRTQFTFLHGPVAAGLCTACHSPHKSNHTKLLKNPMRQSCQFCHKPGDINKNKAHEKTSTISCHDCHYPHGGETLNMLKK